MRPGRTTPSYRRILMSEPWHASGLCPLITISNSCLRCWDAAKDVFVAMGEEQEKAIKCLEKTLEVFEEELKGKIFFAGQSMGYLDLALGWMAFWLWVSEEVACYKVPDVKKFPRFVTWIENFLKVPVIRDNLPDRDKTIEFFHEYRKLQLSALGKV